nr:hypothetical protein [Fredinandcohnia onubensis]
MDNEKEQQLLNLLKYNQDKIENLIQESKSKKDEVKKHNREIESLNAQADLKLAHFKQRMKGIGIDLSKVDQQMAQHKESRATDVKEETFDEHIKPTTYEDLVETATKSGYHETTIEELLTPTEIAEADARVDEINQLFQNKTKLTKVDITFLILATAIQCIRQYVFTSFESRYGHKEGEKAVKEEKEKWKQKFPEGLHDILTDGVPYDVTNGSKELGLGGDGKGYGSVSHRYRTLGHDPILGWVFGTLNILTSTLTDWRFSTYKVMKVPDILGRMSKKIVDEPHVTTGEMIENGIQKALDEKVLLAAAVVTQGLHLKSDVNTKVGLPIPLVSSSLSPEIAEKLADVGIDFKNLATVGKQAGASILINQIIAMIHALFYDEKKYLSREIYEVKTRKILLYSNVLASSSNLIVTALTKDVKKIDVGGLLVTIARLFTDIRFITRVKEEFVYLELDKDLQNEIDRLDGLLE